MKPHTRAASIAMAGAALLAATLTAGPALAAGTVLSPETCPGEVFSVVKNVKTCTSIDTFSSEPTTTRFTQFAGTIRADATYVESYYDTVQLVRTQKGKGPIKTQTLFDSTYTATLVPGSEACRDFDFARGDYVDLPIQDCYDLGLYTVS